MNGLLSDLLAGAPSFRTDQLTPPCPPDQTVPFPFRETVHADKKHAEYLFFPANITRRAFPCYLPYTPFIIEKRRNHIYGTAKET